MKGKSLVILAAVLLLPVVALAQGPSDPKTGYLGWADDVQSRNLPAGTVQDPGSHLTYIIDTGLNARKIANKADLSGVTGANLSLLADGSLLKSLVDADDNDVVDAGALFQTFISISNVHPTQAVTVHFRYYSDNCEDILDFLVVLTCNDTLIFDPLNFVIPFTQGENSRSRLIGPASSVLTPIDTITWGSGRFVITAAASATTINFDDIPEILFPNEWKGYDGDCNIDDDGVLGLSNPLGSIDYLNSVIAAGTGDTEDDEGLRNVGTEGGFSPNNLHVFNASQICFNYLLGAITTAIPGSPSLDQISWGVNAWARPVIDRTWDFGDSNTNDEAFSGSFSMTRPVSPHFRNNPSLAAGTPNPDGDGVHDRTAVANYEIAWGGEAGAASNGTTDGFKNFLFLRNEVHGGDIAGIPSYGTAVKPTYAPDGVPGSTATFTARGSDSWYGALGTSGLYPIPDREGQYLHFLSVSDDYNGSNNAAQTTSALLDTSANISPAVTTYVLQIYDNDENLLTFDIPPSIPISPPQIQATSILKITCICLRVFRNFRDKATQQDQFNGGESVDDLSLKDLEKFGNVFGKVGDFNGLLKTLSPWADGLSADQSGGWMRFVRDNTVRVYVPKDTGTTVEGQFSSGFGTSTFAAPAALGLNDNDTDYGTSFVTIAQYVAKFEGFGVSWWIWTVASDPRVSETGDEKP
jgi:hypothetical protein